MTATAMCRSLLCPAALVALLALGGCRRPSLQGTWVGRDDQDTTVVYTFGPGGSGTYAIGDRQEAMTYRVREGYPTLIEVVVGGPDSAQVRRGIVRILWDGRMRLELGDPGGPAPEQLTADALVLRQPATK